MDRWIDRYTEFHDDHDMLRTYSNAYHQRSRMQKIFSSFRCTCEVRRLGDPPPLGCLEDWVMFHSFPNFGDSFPLVFVNIAMENHRLKKTVKHQKDAPFSIDSIGMLNNQRVN